MIFNLKECLKKKKKEISDSKWSQNIDGKKN